MTRDKKLLLVAIVFIIIIILIFAVSVKAQQPISLNHKFSWDYTDPLTTIQKYELSYESTADPGNIVVFHTIEGDVRESPIVNLLSDLPQGTHDIRVRVVNHLDVRSPWSESLFVDVIKTVPERPTNLVIIIIGGE